MKKLMSCLIIIFLISLSFAQSKPRISPYLSIWGKLINSRTENTKIYYIIAAEFINGYKSSEILTLCTETKNIIVDKDSLCHFYFFYSKYEQNIWELKIIEGGYENYKMTNSYIHFNEIRFEGEREKRLKVGSNSVFLVISNNSNHQVEVFIDDLKLLSTQAFGNDIYWQNLEMKDRINKSELMNYKIQTDTKEIIIPAFVKTIYKLDIYIEENYLLPEEYYRYKDQFKKSIDTMKINTEDLLLWSNFYYYDEMGLKHNSIDNIYHHGVIGGVFVICSKKNNFCNGRNLIF